MKPLPQFGDDMTNVTNNSAMPEIMYCTRMAGRAVIRVVERCETAKENNNLDLSVCELMQIPDAVYHLMRNTVLETCDLSGNAISRIGMQFADKFPAITDLNLSKNRFGNLPDKLSELSQLRTLNISHNGFITLPAAVLKMPALTRLIATNNRIINVDVESLVNAAPTLQFVDLRDNPLSEVCRNELRQACCMRTVEEHEAIPDAQVPERFPVVIVSKPEDEEDWQV